MVNGDVTVVHGLVIKPGDKVLVTLLDEGMEAPVVQDMMDRLAARFPGVEFTVVANAQVAVQPGGGS